MENGTVENSCSNVQKHKTEADTARVASDTQDPQETEHLEAEGELQHFAQDMLFQVHGLDATLPVSCDFCPEKFSDWDSFDAHMRQHRECQQFACQFCNKTYKSRSNLVAHRKTCHLGEVFKCKTCVRGFDPNKTLIYFPIGKNRVGCEECGEGFKTLVQLYNHYHTRHHVMPCEGTVTKTTEDRNEPFACVCPICSSVFATPKKLAIHLARLSNDSTCHTCKDCHEKFCNEASLEVHNCSNFSNHSCCVCGKVLQNAFSLRHYLLRHLRSYACDKCPKIFVSKSVLELHNKTHEVQNKFHCVKCKCQFATWRDLQEHVEEKHVDPDEQLTCHVCGQSPVKTEFLVHYKSCLETKESEESTNQSNVTRPRVKKVVKKCKPPRVPKSFICEYCGQKFGRKSALRLHLRKHISERPYNCPTCSQGFYSKFKLIVHQRRHTGERPFVCRICCKTFTCDRNLKAHIKIHSQVKNYLCPYCGKTFHWECDLTGHIRAHMGERPYRCNICNKTFTMKKRLNFHMKHSVNHSAMSCYVCHENFGTEEELSAHRKEPCSFSCDKCPKAFRHKSALHYHMISHIAHCVKCKCQFATWPDLQEHVEEKHTDPDELLTCHVCGQSPVKTEFLAHYKYCLKTKESENCKRVCKPSPVSIPFICEYCGQVFYNKTNFERHILQHIGKHPYSCELCDKAFYTKYQLIIHVRGHTGERPYICEICNKAFADPCTLRKHDNKVHNNVKPYTCHFCNKKFAWSTNFIRHVRLHTGERPYCCNVCHKEFVLKNDFNRHMKKHHIWTCSDCGKKFSTEDELAAHGCEEH